MAKTIMHFLNVKPVIVALVRPEVQYFSSSTLLMKKFYGRYLCFQKKEVFVELQGLLDIVKTQFVDGLRLQELIQKKLQLIFS